MNQAASRRLPRPSDSKVSAVRATLPGRTVDCQHSRTTTNSSSKASRPVGDILVISDVHANWPALEAVLEAQAFDRVVVVGDLVSYGPHPREVVRDPTYLPMVRSIGRRLVINPGSVGQPRDGDSGASFAVIENGNVALKRVTYDVERTGRDLRGLPVPPEIVDRLV